MVTDWVAWHREYDDPSSAISARLISVQRHLADAIDRAAPGRISVLSLCAGQGRDVIGVLPAHSRRADVTALLVEADPANAEQAARRAGAAGLAQLAAGSAEAAGLAQLAAGSAEAAGLAQLAVRQADASLVASFADALPADVLLLCGIFGNVSDADIRRTVLTAPLLCADGATVIWTRHRRPPDLTVAMRDWFAEAGFDEVAFDALDTEKLTAVGAHRLRSRPARSGMTALPPGPLFTFFR